MNEKTDHESGNLLERISAIEAVLKDLTVKVEVLGEALTRIALEEKKRLDSAETTEFEKNNSNIGEAENTDTNAINSTTLLTPSAALTVIIGSEPLPHEEAIKKIWVYIMKHGLQDSKNRRMINADDRLRTIFGGEKKISMFEMTKYVSKHLK